MMIASLLAAVLSLPVSAHAAGCQSNEMTQAWEKITYGLWLTPYTIPDSTPRTATLTYQGCSVGADGLESRTFGSAEGNYSIVARTNGGGENGATTLVLQNGSETVVLGTWGHHKAMYRPVGVDQVNVPNGNGGAFKSNVFFIPVDLGLKP